MPKEKGYIARTTYEYEMGYGPLFISYTTYHDSEIEAKRCDTEMAWIGTGYGHGVPAKPIKNEILYCEDMPGQERGTINDRAEAHQRRTGSPYCDSYKFQMRKT